MQIQNSGGYRTWGGYYAVVKEVSIEDNLAKGTVMENGTDKSVEWKLNGMAINQYPYFNLILPVPGGITPDQVVAYLNDLLALDPNMVQALFASSVLCNKVTATQTQMFCQSLGEETFQTSLVGLLNGLFMEHGYNCAKIALRVDDNKVVGFEELNKEAEPEPRQNVNTCQEV